VTLIRVQPKDGKQDVSERVDLALEMLAHVLAHVLAQSYTAVDVALAALLSMWAAREKRKNIWIASQLFNGKNVKHHVATNRSDCTFPPSALCGGRGDEEEVTRVA